MDFDLGQKIRTYRRGAGLSQQALADLAKVSKQTIFAIENGRTESSHPRTIRLIQSALQARSHVPVMLLGPENVASANLLSGMADTSPLHAKLNAPDRRVSEIAKICPEIADDAEEVTRFVSFDDIITEFSWLRPAQFIQTTTIEYSDLWNDQSVFVSYEATLLQFRQAGRPLNRLFIVDENLIKNVAYRNMVARVVFRHSILGFEPHVIIKSDVRSMHKEMRINCDAIMFFDASAALALLYSIDNKPLFLSSNNPAFCSNGSNVFGRYWRASMDAQSFLKRVELPPGQRLRAEREAGWIEKASSYLIGFDSGL